MNKTEMAQKIEDLQKDIEALEHENVKLKCSLHVEQNKCENCISRRISTRYSKMTDYDRLIDFLEKSGIKYDEDTYTYESEKGDSGVLKSIVKFGKLDFKYFNEYEYEIEEKHETHHFVCEFDENEKFVKMYNEEEI